MAFVAPFDFCHAAQVQFSTGQPTTPQNIDLRVWELEYQHPLWNISKQWKLDYLGGLGKITTETGNSQMMFSGVGLRWLLPKRIRLLIDGKLLRLSEHRFEGSQARAKDYGGNFQFSTSVSLLIPFNQRVSVGYRLQHMSNADMYPHNPGMNSHSLLINLSL